MLCVWGAEMGLVGLVVWGPWEGGWEGVSGLGGGGGGGERGGGGGGGGGGVMGGGGGGGEFWLKPKFGIIVCLKAIKQRKNVLKPEIKAGSSLLSIEVDENACELR